MEFLCLKKVHDEDYEIICLLQKIFLLPLLLFSTPIHDPNIIDSFPLLLGNEALLCPSGPHFVN